MAATCGSEVGHAGGAMRLSLSSAMHSAARDRAPSSRELRRVSGGLGLSAPGIPRSASRIALSARRGLTYRNRRRPDSPAIGCDDRDPSRPRRVGPWRPHSRRLLAARPARGHECNPLFRGGHRPQRGERPSRRRGARREDTDAGQGSLQRTDRPWLPRSCGGRRSLADGAGRLLYELDVGESDAARGELDGHGLAISDLDPFFPPEGRGEHCTSAKAASFPIVALLPNANDVATAATDPSGDRGDGTRVGRPNAQMARDPPPGSVAGRLGVRPATFAAAPSSPRARGPAGARRPLRPDVPMEGDDAGDPVHASVRRHGPGRGREISR